MARPGLRQRLFLSSAELVSYDRQFDCNLEDKGKAKTQDLDSAEGMCALKSDLARDTFGPCNFSASNILFPPQSDIQQRPASLGKTRRNFFPAETVADVAKFFHFSTDEFSKLGVVPLIHGHSEALLLAIY
jgi:hypothetical protein